MSKKTSPQSRPQRRPRTRGPQPQRATGTGSSTAAAERAKTRRRESNAPVPTTFSGRLRRFLPTVLVPNVVAVLSVIVVALAVLMLSSTEMAALAATIAQLWLALNLVPLQVGGTVIGLLPLLPAMGLVWLLARQIRRAVKDRVSVADLGVLYILTLLIPLILSGIAMGMLWDASSVYEVDPPKLLELLPRVIVLHSVAMMIGMGGKLWRALCKHYGLPEALVSNARSALRFLGYLSVAAMVVLLVAMALGWQRQVEMAEIYDGGGALVALGFVSLLYLPNAVIGAAAVLVGSEFHIGEASVSLFSIHHTPLPPLPLVAAIPADTLPGLYVLLVVAAAIAGFLAYRANPTLVSAVSTSAFAALFAAVAGYLAQGALGEFGPSGPMVWLSAGLVFLWMALAGVTTALLLKLVERRQAQIAGYEDAAASEEEVQEDLEGTEDSEATEATEATTDEPAEDSAEDSGDNDGEDDELTAAAESTDIAEDPEEEDTPEEAASAHTPAVPEEAAAETEQTLYIEDRSGDEDAAADSGENPADPESVSTPDDDDAGEVTPKG
ncbi:cell division protein PerM [Corynebacterium sp. A21]|uniref:cell division protein PerM n=1 Tax=Corynebacterium sp. A21 TaxID=3457318 RepID=UPI003FD1C4EE